MNTNYEISEEVFDYLVVVNPDALVAKDVTRIRQFIATELGDTKMSAAPVAKAMAGFSSPTSCARSAFAMVLVVRQRCSVSGTGPEKWALIRSGGE